MATHVSGKRKFVADAAFYAELNELLTRELAEDGYPVEVRVTTTGAVVVEIPRKEEASPATYRNKTVNGVFGENHKP